MKPEVLEIQEEADEIQDLSARTNGLFEGEESKGWGEVPEALLNGWHKVGKMKEVYSKLLEIRERGEVKQVTLAEPCGIEPVMVDDPHAYLEPLDEWK